MGFSFCYGVNVVIFSKLSKMIRVDLYIYKIKVYKRESI